jgi:hypothetical protein
MTFRISISLKSEAVVTCNEKAAHFEEETVFINNV